MTDEQFNILSKWEDNFRTALRSQWARHPGSSALLQIHQIYSALTGTSFRLNTTCQSCVLQELQRVGKLYFAEKEIRAEKQAQTEKTSKTTKKPARAKKSKSKAEK